MDQSTAIKVLIAWAAKTTWLPFRFSVVPRVGTITLIFGCERKRRLTRTVRIFSSMVQTRTRQRAEEIDRVHAVWQALQVRHQDL